MSLYDQATSLITFFKKSVPQRLTQAQGLLADVGDL